MSQGYKFYAARAVEAKAEAAEATLENVRLRALRSEAMWLQLADHARKVEADRIKHLCLNLENNLPMDSLLADLLECHVMGTIPDGFPNPEALLASLH